MLIIEKNSINKLVVTASEMTDYDDSSFVLQFKSKQTLEVVQCTATDTSAFKKRYNYLTITDTATPTASNEVNLKLGYHEYTVLSNAGDVLERGLALVIWQRSAVTEHTRNNTNIVYEKNY